MDTMKKIIWATVGVAVFFAISFAVNDASHVPLAPVAVTEEARAAQNKLDAEAQVARLALSPQFAPVDPKIAEAEKRADAARREKEAAQMRRAEPKPKPEDLRPARRALADLLETGMLAQGLDAHVKVVGQQLCIEHILVNRPYVFREINDRDFVASLRTIGFKSIRFSNGYDYTVTWAIPSN
jgi:hypothetical protein